MLAEITINGDQIVSIVSIIAGAFVVWAVFGR